MTEAEEWSVAVEPGWLLCAAEIPPPTARKLRLLAAAWCRRAWAYGLLDRQVCQYAVEASEQYADGLLTSEVLFGAHEAVASLRPRRRMDSFQFRHVFASREDATFAFAALTHLSTREVKVVMEHGWAVPEEQQKQSSNREELHRLEQIQKCALIRDVFRNPFRAALPLVPAVFAWEGGQVVQLGRSAYEERALPTGTLDPARLGVLADALEEAGCADADLLAHLREPGPHVRGCWAVDAVLGKS